MTVVRTGPPFDGISAAVKARKAEDAWNALPPEKIALAYTPDSVWCDRGIAVRGRAEIVAFLTRLRAEALEFRLIKEVWAWEADRIAVRFVYEWHDASGQWFRSYGNENWEFDEAGLMQRRLACVNDCRIEETQRLFRWPAGERRPDDHPGLSDLGL